MLPDANQPNLFNSIYVSEKHEAVRQLIIRIDLFLKLDSGENFLKFSVPLCFRFFFKPEQDKKLKNTEFWLEIVNFLQKCELQNKIWFKESTTPVFIDKIVEKYWFKIISYPILTINQTGWLIENEEWFMDDFVTFAYNKNKRIDAVIINIVGGEKSRIPIAGVKYKSYKSFCEAYEVFQTTYVKLYKRNNDSFDDNFDSFDDSFDSFDDI